MNNDRVQAYANAMLAVARAEGNADEVADEMFRFARALDGSDELRMALADRPVAVRSVVGGLGDHLRRLVETGIDHFVAGVCQSSGHDLRSPVVPIETGLGDENSYFAGTFTHGEPSLIS